VTLALHIYFLSLVPFNLKHGVFDDSHFELYYEKTGNIPLKMPPRYKNHAFTAAYVFWLFFSFVKCAVNMEQSSTFIIKIICFDK